MKCFCCNERETTLGYLLCRTCQDGQRHHEVGTREQEQARIERWRKCTYTWLYFCGTCGIEVYREARVPRRRNWKREQERNQQGRLALFKHVQKAQHAARLNGPVQINDLSGDDEYEVPALGLPEDRCPRAMQASSVMRALGKVGLVVRWDND